MIKENPNKLTLANIRMPQDEVDEPEKPVTKEQTEDVKPSSKNKNQTEDKS